MAKAHTLGYRNMGATYNLPRGAILDTIVGTSDDKSAEAARRLGFERFSSNWESVVADPRIDVVSVTTPNILRAPAALAALNAGKHCYCEKPLSTTLDEAKRMADTAENSGLVTQVGFNYIKNPILSLAREMIDNGELGKITAFRGIHAEGYMSDPATRWTWRLATDGGGGALMDLGSHIVNMARFLLGPIDRLCADVETIIKSRPRAFGLSKCQQVEVDDQARLLVRFARGCSGTIEASWTATGRTMQLAFEVVGERGSLVFTRALQRIAVLQA